MENLPVTKEALIKSLSMSSPAISAANEISLYKGSIISDESIVRYSVKIRQAFPSLEPGFYNILLEMAKEENFTDERFRDAVHNVIKTCIYPTPTIAQFISFDKRIKVFKYHDIIKMVDDGDHNAFDRYKRVEMDGLPEAVWIHKNDIAKYNIK